MALHCGKKLWKLCDTRYDHCRPACSGAESVEASMLTPCLETKHFIYFYLGHCAILLFKTQ
jgi:hypothetical protein